MRKFGLLAAAFAMAAFVSGQAMAQSSKFAASYDTGHDLLALSFECEPAVGWCDQFNSGLGFAGHLANIKATQGKELLIGLSGVPILLTYTEAKGKNGEGFTEAVSLAGVGMAVAYAHVDDLDDDPTPGEVCLYGLTNDQLAAPGIVPMSIRLQYLAVQSNLFPTEGSTDDIQGDVTVALGLLTAASHHFNFLAANLAKSGNYKVAACFVGGTLSDVLDGKDGKVFSVAALGKRMLTVQEVRAVKDAEFDVTN